MKTVEQNSIQLAHRIIAIPLKEHRRSELCNHHEYHDCLMPHVNKPAKLITKNEIVRFVLPAFPAKSPNPSKIYGALPDLGEHLALCFLNQLCCSLSARGSETKIW